jgi:serine O-acetyltransferase
VHYAHPVNLASLHRINHRLYTNGHKKLAKFGYHLAFLIFNSSVPPSVVIGPGSRFAYGGVGVVVHGRATIGNSCLIGQGVTIGGRNREWSVPTIGDHVYLGAGCRVLGPVSVGNNSIVGANAVVLSDVPANSIVVGVPARVVRSGIDPADYI